MELAERGRLNIEMNGGTRIMWWLGWNPTPTYILLVSMALFGWVVLRHPAGLLLGLLALVPWWKAISLINRNGQGYLDQAKLHVKGEGASRLGVHLDTALCNVSSIGRGKRPFGASWEPQYDISVVYIDNEFFAVYQAAIFNLHDFTVQLPQQGEEIYYRHVSAVNYRPPHVEVTLSDGKTIKRFSVGSDGGSAVVSALRAKLRAPVPSAMSVSEQGVLKSGTLGKLAYHESATSVGPGGEVAQPDNTNEERYCYLRVSKLRQLLADPSVLDVLVEQLQVPGELAVHRQLTQQQKMESIEAQIDHFRRTPTSVWYGVPTLEVLAASLWRAQDDEYCRNKKLLTKKLVRRRWFCDVSDEADLTIPVARWLKSLGYDPYMEIPMGSGRVDVLGYKKTSLSGSGSLTAIELKNDYGQFKRLLNQASTFAEYANLVYIACTPAFAADYLDRNENSVKHWDATALERKITGGGIGLLIVERDQVFEVVKPIERTPTGTNFSRVLSALSAVNLIEC
jgi:hypothetical protein